MLHANGVRAVVQDRGTDVGGAWPHRYDALRLNTVRWMSDLPGLRMGSELDRWVARDDLTDYLRRYADWHHLDLRLGSTVDRVDPIDGGRWSVASDQGAEIADAVVVATGHSREGRVPEWPGAAGFDGEILHSSAYRNADQLPGDHVGVVGAGSSGGEIILDLLNAGRKVTWSVRTAPRVFPREALGVPVTPLAPIAEVFPDRLIDRAAPWLERAVYGRRDYLPEPQESMTRLLASCKEPMTADGIVERLRSGAIEVVPAVESFSSSGLVLADGREHEVDTVIAATGFSPGLERLVGHLGVLDGEGRPRSLTPRRGLGFVGYRIPLTGTLWAIETDARRAARTIAEGIGDRR